jgi:hypothetical protein
MRFIYAKSCLGVVVAARNAACYCYHDHHRCRYRTSKSVALQVKQYQQDLLLQQSAAGVGACKSKSQLTTELIVSKIYPPNTRRQNWQRTGDVIVRLRNVQHAQQHTHSLHEKECNGGNPFAFDTQVASCRPDARTPPKRL